MIKQKVYYWCPFIGKVATINAVINSAYSLVKYSKGKIESTIINSCGEWNYYKKEIGSKDIKFKELNNKFNINISANGFINSRIEYLKVFFSCFFLLKKFLKKEKPDFLIIHLLTSLPILLFFLYKFDTKLILRISGKVKLNFLRRFFWNLAGRNIYRVTCPTQESVEEINKMNIFDEFKVGYLPDPIIDINKVSLLKKNDIQKNFLGSNYFVCIGRFTKQKNHQLLIEAFNKLKHILHDFKLLIIGEGELKKGYIKTIKEKNLEKFIHILDFSENIYNYLSHSSALISTSLWEDPGFVMIESAACNTLIISSDCPSGPKEFVNQDCGILFKNNNLSDLIQKITIYLNLSDDVKFKLKLNAKKKAIQFTKFRHFQIAKNIFQL